MKYILFFSGTVIAITANLPSIVAAYFPYNLLFGFFGGGLVGWYGNRIILSKKNKGKI